MKQTKLKQRYLSRMLKMLILLVVFSNSSLTTNAQVTIGNEEQPIAGSLLQIKSKPNITDDGANSNRGLALPRVALSEKKQLFPMFLTNPDDSTSGANADYTTNKSAIDKAHTGLIVYNLTENDDKELCLGLNQWDGEQWNCFQSKMGNAIASIDNCDNITFSGVYQDKVSLNSGNYMNITLNVTKAGAYTVTARASYAGDNSVDNGYYFTTTGVFLTTGTYALQIPGNGTPLKYTPSSNPSGDVITIFMNDKQLTLADGSTTCPKNIVVEDSSVKPLYTMDCSKTKVYGVYKIDEELDTDQHYIEVTLNSDAPYGATYHIETNTVDGIYFKGSGLLTGATQTVKLIGYGIPTSMTDKKLTITSNSKKSVATCSATVYMCYTKKRILGIGYYNNSFGYHLQSGSAPYKVLTASQNFGTAMNSIIKIDGFEFGYIDGESQGNISGTGIINQTALDQELAKNPDIILVGYFLNFDSATIQKLQNYIYNGGVLLLFSEVYYGNASTMVNAFMKSLFGDNGITYNGRNAAGDAYQFAGVNDEVLVGSFGDLRGKRWGEDASATLILSGIPSGDIITYTGANAANNSTTYSGVSMFRHRTLNLFWCGDGGFLSNPSGYVGSYGSTTICPFAMDASYNPITRTGWSGGNIENSRFFCNLMAWAIKQAQFNGINTP